MYYGNSVSRKMFGFSHPLFFWSQHLTENWVASYYYWAHKYLEMATFPWSMRICFTVWMQHNNCCFVNRIQSLNYLWIRLIPDVGTLILPKTSFTIIQSGPCFISTSEQKYWWWSEFLLSFERLCSSSPYAEKADQPQHNCNPNCHPGILVKTSCH